MSVRTRLAGLAVPGLLALLDLWTKALAGPYPDGAYASRDATVVVPGWLEFRASWNPGALFGFDWFPPLLLLVLTALAVPLLLWWILAPRRVGWTENLGKLLVLGGALGNLHDRIRWGRVRDFINVYYGTMEPRPSGDPARHWPTFNLADSCLVVGVGLLLLVCFLEWRGQRGSEGRAGGTAP
ncbi:MAG: signal peptidase II [Planctomycetota bacterium]